MDSSPFKRRKLSPTASVAANAFDNHPSREGWLASFQSPTKSSLARFNPHLLPQPKSIGEGADGEGDNLLRSDGAPLAKGLNPLPLRPTTPKRGALAASPSPTRKSLSIGGALSVSPRRRSQTPGAASPTRAEVFLPKRKLRRSIVPAIRASPPEELSKGERLEADVVALDGQLEQELQADARQFSTESQSQQPATVPPANGDPELPLTPTQLGLEPPLETPKGLLYSSPTRRPLRKRGAAKSSPLKPRDLALEQAPSDLPSPENIQENIEIEQLLIEKREEDLEILRKTEILERLSKQLQDLQGDVTILEKHVVRAQNPSETLFDTREEVDALLSIITSKNPTHKPLAPPPKPLDLSARLALFLPFAAKRRPLNDPLTIPTSPPPSHAPILDPNPLPYLTYLTPFAITSRTHITPPTTDAMLPTTQTTHTLTAPSNLLSLTLNLTTAITPTPTINALTLTDLTPWATPELGPFIRTQLPTADLPTIAHGAARYHDVALLRAQCWQSCHERYPSLLASTTGAPARSAGPTRAKDPATRAGRPRSSTAVPPNAEPEGDDDADAAQPSQGRSSGANTAETRAHLGRRSLHFARDGAELVVTWAIGLDWTGEAQSRVRAAAAFPAAWRARDGRGALGGVGRLFGRLVRERGVEGAVAVCVAVLFPG